MDYSIRRGTVQSVNYQEGTVKIVQEDRDDSVSFDLPMMSFEYNPPDIGDMAIAVFLSNDSTQGFVIGKPYNALNRPTNGAKGVIRKDYDIDAFIEYSKENKTLTISAQRIIFKGDVKTEE